MLARAGVVVACSPALVDRRGADREVRLIPNAVDAAHFTAPQPRPADLPDGATVVYVGTLHRERLDVDLVTDLARSIPCCAVVLVGPDALDQASRNQLLVEPNVQLLGARPYRSVPGYLQHADVLIVPHLVSSFTESLDPIKGYEILAVGRPAVVTPVAGLRDLGPPVRCVARDAFVDTVRNILADPPVSAPQPVAGWAERAKLFDEALHDAARDSR
jgi:glycosyltransferase involved in cell wall biosynthesis